MANKRSKKSKQQKRQAASERTRQRREAQAAEEQRVPQIPEGPISPGDRLNLMVDEFSHRLDGSPFAARAVAAVIDYLLCGMLAMAPLIVAHSMVRSESLRNLADLAGAGMFVIVCVLAVSLLVSFAYYVLIPLKLWPGKTPGKYLTHVEIVMLDGTPATLGALTLRWAFMTFVETMLTFASALLIQFVTLVAGDLVGNVYTFAGGAASAVSAWLVWTKKPNRCALHDLVAGTWVWSDVGGGKGKRKGAGRKAARR